MLGTKCECGREILYITHKLIGLLPFQEVHLPYRSELECVSFTCDLGLIPDKSLI
jgi:hypothetical protein